MARQKSGIFRCKNSFAYPVGKGVTRVCKAGSLVDADNPAYKHYKAAFEVVEEFVEQATAGPGEQRISKPREETATEKPKTTAKSKGK